MMRKISRRILMATVAVYLAKIHVAWSAEGSDHSPALDRLRTYFSALSGRRYTEAFSIWEKQNDEQSINGQTLQGFTEGFSNTVNAAIEFGLPTDPEGAAGSQYVEIPVTIRALLKDGRKQLFKGTYTMRSSTVADDHKWYIYRAHIKQHY